MLPTFQAATNTRQPRDISRRRYSYGRSTPLLERWPLFAGDRIRVHLASGSAGRVCLRRGTLQPVQYLRGIPVPGRLLGKLACTSATSFWWSSEERDQSTSSGDIRTFSRLFAGHFGVPYINLLISASVESSKQSPSGHSKRLSSEIPPLFGETIIPEVFLVRALLAVGLMPLGKGLSLPARPS